MIEVKYKGKTLGYDEGKNEIYVDSKKDESGKFSPAFVNNGEKEKPTFIGFTENTTKTFISLNGKLLKTVSPEEIDL